MPDFIADRPPSYRPPPGATGVDAISGADPFIMQADGKGVAVRPGRDGRRPAAHTLRAAGIARSGTCSTGQQHESGPADPPASGEPLSARAATSPGSEVFPYVITTYRLTEHHTAGGMCRWLPYLSELQPEMFCEVSPRAGRRARPGAPRLGHDHLTARDAIEARVLVTERMTPLRCTAGRCIRSGCPTTGAPNGTRVSGDAANELARVALDPNVHDPGGQGHGLRHPAGPTAPRGGPAGNWSRSYRRAGRDNRQDGRRRCECRTDAAPHGHVRAYDPAARRRSISITRRGWDSSPTPRYASAARPARWRARSGTRVPARRADLNSLGIVLRQHRGAWAPAPGGTSPSSSSRTARGRTGRR